MRLDEKRTYQGISTTVFIDENRNIKALLQKDEWTKDYVVNISDLADFFVNELDCGRMLRDCDYLEQEKAKNSDNQRG